jgi:hypothetical protein
MNWPADWSHERRLGWLLMQRWIKQAADRSQLFWALVRAQVGGISRFVSIRRVVAPVLSAHSPSRL